MLMGTRFIVAAAFSAVVVIALSACPNNTTVTPIVTSVGKSVGTFQQTSSLVNCAGTNPPPLAQEPQDWWNGVQAANRLFPFAGWEAFQTGVGGCAVTRVDAYRAVVTFNLGSVSNLKGLVQKASLTVATHILPAGIGTTLNAGPLGQTGSINLFCPTNQGGAGALVRFGPAAVIPTTLGTGSFEMLGANSFPAGTAVVYKFPSSFHAGPVAGAIDATTAAASGTGGSAYITDVTGAVTAALNANATGLTWMLTSDNEGPLPGALTTSGDVDCRTSYSFDLQITHL
jgi:hypothetical protein